MFKTIKHLSLPLLFLTGLNAQGLFFSEYAEGSSNNKYLEIYNPTSETIDLSGYGFPSVSNAPSTPGEYEYWNSFSDGATIAPGDVYVIAHGSADPAILAFTDQTHNYLSNGDDGYALVQGTETSYTALDWVGDFNADPGSGWDVCGTENGTKDHTLVRISSVTQGSDWSVSSATETCEWEIYDSNTWDYLGWHIEQPFNSAPVADAGADIVTMVDETTGIAVVTLDGSGTYDLDGDAMTYSWVLNSAEVSTEVSFTTDLAVGVHTFTLTVNDGELDGTDDVVVTVTEFLNSYAVTFNINMSLETVSDDGVRISGLSDDYIAMADDDADGIYTVTVELFTGDYTYNFRNGWGYESGDNLGDCAGGDYGNDRSVTVVDADVTLGTVCWESCEDCPVDVYGCMDVTALNYDPNATIDDGSCVYPDPDGGNLFFSEYIEGSSSNKAIEIYNPADHTIDLVGTEIWRISNGGDWTEGEGNAVSLEGYSIDPGDVFVICNGDIADEYLGECDVVGGDLNGATYFNGDDAMGLAYNGILIDAIGTEGDDPGSGWDVADVLNGTKDHTLVRVETVLSGNTDWAISSADEWVVFDQNTFDYLGSHPHDFYVNQAPTADAGVDFEAMVDESTGLVTVTLDGSGSYDPDGDVITYSWAYDGTEVSTDVSFTADLTVGIYTYALTVNDGEFDATDDVVVTITEYVEPLTPLLSEDFETGEGDFTNFSVASDENWYHSSYSGNSFMKISGYGGSEYSDDWLYTPAMNFDLFTAEVLSFTTACNYDGPALEVKISNDFVGGDPSLATWADLTVALSDGGWNWVETGNIDVSGFGGTAVTIAFRYLSDETGSKTWEVDDVFVGGYPTDVMAATPVITPAGGLYFDPVDVSVTCETPGATIYYTLDGTDPTDASTLYDAILSVNADVTVKAIAYAEGYLPSLISSEAYSFPIVATIYEIQGQADASPYVDQIVETSGIITATGGSKHFIQDGTGAWNGLYIYDGDNTYAVGDYVTLVGEVTEYYDLTEIMNIVSITVTSSGNELPASAILTTGEVNAEAYEGVLVTTTGICDNEANDYGEWSVNDGTGTIWTDDAYYVFTPVLSEEYIITGPVTYGYGNFKILPRDDSDVVHLEDVPEFTFTVNVAGASDNHDVTVGFSRDATDGYDAEIDQYAPPAPPAPAFDVALGWENDRYYTQILNGSIEDWSAEHTFEILLQYDESNTANLTWDNTELNNLGTFILQDAFGGIFVNVVMNNTTSLTLDDPMITMLKFRVTPGDYIEPVPVPDFVCTLNVAGEGSDSDLMFGFSPDATDGYDVGIDLYHPPPPPPPAFDASLSWDGDRYFTQILNGAVEDWDVEHVYDVQLQYDESNVITLTWDNTLWLYYGSFVLQDAFGGALINVDMNQTTSLTLTDPAYNLLKLKVTPGAYEPPPTYDVVLNEFLVSSENCCGPENSDFIELYNTGTEDLNISGWGFSDEDGVVATSAPEGTIIPVGGYIVAWYTGDADGWPEVDDKLSAGGESIYIEDAEGYTVVLHNYDDSFDYDDISANLMSDGTYVASVTPTPEEANIITPLVLGCTDDEALNYDTDANYDDGSCEYPAAPQNLVAEADTASILLTWVPADMGEENDGFDFAITIEVDGAGETSYTLTAGFSPEATDGYDDGIDLYAPPAPPPPSFDAALGWSMDRYYTQILNGVDGDASEHVFDIQLQFDTNNIINLNWDNTGLAALGTFILQDAFGGAMINVDMTEESTYTVDNPAFNLLKLKITPAVYEPSYSVYRDGALHAEGLVETTYLDTTGLNESIEHCYTVTQVLPGGIESAHSDMVCATPIWLALDDQLVPNVFALHQNYPNPFNPITTIVYDIAEESSVRLNVYNIMGQQVRTLIAAHQAPGRYQVQWDSTNDHGEPLPSGLYIYTIDAAGFTAVKKLVLMK